MNRHPQREMAAGAVVVGVDSKTSQQTVEWAAAQAGAEGRPLVLAHATGALGTVGTTWLQNADPATSRPLQEMAKQGDDVVRPIAERLRHTHPDLEVRALVVADDPGLELLELAKAAHLLVLGAHSNWFTRVVPLWRLGARASQRAACPVVVVPSYKATVVRRGVLVGTDASPRSRAAVEFAYGYASQHHLPLTVVRVTRSDGQGPDHENRMLAEAIGGLSEDYPDLAVQQTVVKGWPSRTLLDMSEEMHLLVVGRHHALTAYESPVGHVRSTLVDRASCPVAVVAPASTADLPG
jgi:nucleotide-binding universal stress UspA family protein